MWWRFLIVAVTAVCSLTTCVVLIRQLLRARRDHRLDRIERALFSPPQERLGFSCANCDHGSFAHVLSVDICGCRTYGRCVFDGCPCQEFVRKEGPVAYG